MKKYPLKLSYITKTALWGGTRLKTDFNKASEYDTVSESWELSVREKEMSTVLNGEGQGMTLEAYFRTVGYDCIAKGFSCSDRFPLLVKLIDANDVLSIQVHPDDEYASTVENDVGKTEMWYIVDTKDGAEIIYGLKNDISREDFVLSVKENRNSQIFFNRWYVSVPPTFPTVIGSHDNGVFTVSFLNYLFNTG